MACSFARTKPLCLKHRRQGKTQKQTAYAKGPVIPTGPFLLYIENHSLGEWFKRRLMSIMEKEKLPLLYWECGLPTAQASKGRSFKNERRK